MRRIWLSVLLLVAVPAAWADDSDSGIQPGQPWVDDGSTLFPGADRDVDLSDDTPHLTLRDSDTDLAYQFHVEDAAADPWRGLTLWQGTLTASGGTFAIGTTRPPVRLDQSGNFFLDNLQSVSAARCLELSASGQVTLAAAACGTGGGNSFETISVPAGTNPVADSSTDTLTITETSPLVITGTAATDTIDLTWSSVDLGADGTIQANAVALATDTTGAYVADLTAGTAIDVSGGGAENATVTVDWDSTEVEATTWGAGGNASNAWTFNLSGTDWTMTAGSALATFSAGVTVSGTTTLGVLAGAVDAGGATSFEVPNGASPTVDAAGEAAVDTTDDQLIYYGAAKRVIPYERTVGFVIESLAAADDNYAFFMVNDAITVTGVGCNCRGTCSTLATFTLEDRGGNAMTITGTNPTCATTGAATFAAVTAGNQLTAGEMVAFDVTNTPTTGDTYGLFITYAVDAQ